MNPFELILFLLFVLTLLYFVTNSKTFKKISKKLFPKDLESTDGIVERVESIEEDKTAVSKALSARQKALAEEEARLKNIQVK